MSDPLYIKQVDLLEHTIQSYEAKCLNFEKGYLVYEKDGEIIKVSLNKDEVMIMTNSTFLYSRKNKGQVKVNHGYGELVFDLKIVSSSIEDNKMMVEYLIMNNDEIISHYSFEWKV